MIRLPDLATASRATGIAPDTVQRLRDYWNNPRAYHHGNHPFPIALGPAEPCPLLTDWDYMQRHLSPPTSLVAADTYEKYWAIGSMPDEHLWHAAGALITQHRKIYEYALGIDAEELRRMGMRARFMARYGLVAPGARQYKPKFHYDSFASRWVFSIATVNAGPTEHVRGGASLPPDLPPADDHFADYVARNDLIVRAPVMTLTFFDGNKCLHRAGVMPEPEDPARPNYRCFVASDLYRFL